MPAPRVIKSTLNQHEVKANARAIEVLIAEQQKMLKSFFNNLSENAALLNSLLVEFTSEKNIALAILRQDGQLTYNLLDTEKAELIQIIAESLGTKLKDNNRIIDAKAKLNKWEPTLTLAVTGRDDLDKVHNFIAPSFASELISSGKIPLTAWGTDDDINLYFLDTLSVEKNINRGGVHILSAIPLNSDAADGSDLSLHDSVSDLADRLKDVLDALKKNNVMGPVSLRIPASCDSHWRLVKVEILNQSVTSAELWDSFPEADSLNTPGHSIAIANLNAAIRRISASQKVPVTVEFAGVQKNSHSCLDYVLQQSTQEIEDATKAAGTNADELRLAVIKQIVKNHSDLGEDVANRLQIDGEFITQEALVDDVVSTADDLSDDDLESEEFTPDQKNTLTGALISNKTHQVNFDETLANNLSALYKADFVSTDAELERKALQATIKSYAAVTSAKTLNAAQETQRQEIREALLQLGLFAPTRLGAITPDNSPTASPKAKHRVS
jgi:hypothetical protein